MVLWLCVHEGASSCRQTAALLSSEGDKLESNSYLMYVYWEYTAAFYVVLRCWDFQEWQSSVLYLSPLPAQLTLHPLSCRCGPENPALWTNCCSTSKHLEYSKYVPRWELIVVPFLCSRKGQSGSNDFSTKYTFHMLPLNTYIRLRVLIFKDDWVDFSCQTLKAYKYY